MNPRNRILHFHTPMTAAAMCLLLAACGGGSGGGTSEKAVSSSPAATGSAISTAGVNTAMPGAPAPALDAGSADQVITNTAPGDTAGSTGAGTKPGPDTSASSSTPPVAPRTSAQTLTDQGIRGDVLRSMLDQKLNQVGPRDTPSSTPADGRHGWFKFGTGIPRITNSVRLSPDNYVDESRPSIPWPLLRYRPLNGEAQYLLNSYIQSRWGINRDTTVPVRPFSLKLDLQADREKLTLGQTLTLDISQPVASWQTRPDGPGETLTLTLQAGDTIAIARDALISFGQVIQRWQAAPDQKVELVLADRCDLVRVNDSGQRLGEQFKPTPGSELCWRIDTPNLKREVCTMYEVPIATIAPDDEPKALAQSRLQEMADERSTFPGESGSIFWRQGHLRCEGKGDLL
ncbi:MAG: hypothetical protein Q4B17_10215 [Lautropia sp.]|nr:hypothetical protein [Lautropia sp.]